MSDDSMDYSAGFGDSDSGGAYGDSGDGGQIAAYTAYGDSGDGSSTFPVDSGASDAAGDHDYPAMPAEPKPTGSYYQVICQGNPGSTDDGTPCYRSRPFDNAEDAYADARKHDEFAHRGITYAEVEKLQRGAPPAYDGN